MKKIVLLHSFYSHVIIAQVFYNIIIHATFASMFLVRGNIQKHQGMSDYLKESKTPKETRDKPITTITMNHRTREMVTESFYLILARMQ